jgi:polyisoprenoid-binding protein YceI
MTTATATPTIAPAGTWAVDPSHSSVEFQVKHMGIATVKGFFHGFDGALTIGEDGSARAEGTVDVATVDTREAKRDEHLRSPDFFDAERFPTLTFVSTGIRAEDDDEYVIDGELTIHGVTQPVSLRAEVTGSDVDPWGNERVALDVSGKIKRSDYGMTFNQALGSGNMLVGDAVKIALSVSAVRSA